MSAIEELQKQIDSLQSQLDELKTLELNKVSRLNVGTATGATTGQIRASGSIYAGVGASSNISLGANTTQGFLSMLSTGNADLLVSPVPGSGAGQSLIRMFRSVNTSGAVSLQVYKGDNTATINHQLAGNIDSALCADNGNLYLGGAGNAANVILYGDIYNTAWSDYATSSLIVGWSSFTTKVIRYKKVGKLVFVCFNIVGTSNSTSTSFTLPYTSANTTVAFYGACRYVNNGSGGVAPGRTLLPANSIACTVNTDWAGSAWTSSGSKEIQGEFWYESA